MLRDLDENGVGLYRVSYVHDQNEHTVDSMLLPLGRKDKTKVKGIIAILKSIRVKSIKKVKLKFRKKLQGFISGLAGTKAYNAFIELQKEIKKRRALEEKRQYRSYVTMNPYEPKSKTIIWKRYQYINDEQLRQTIQKNHTEQRLRYYLDIQFGYVLQNVETGEQTNYTPNQNTSFFGGNQFMVNTDISVVLDQIHQDSITEQMKRPNTKYSIEKIYEYVVLTTPIPEVPIGAKVKLPSFIKNSKSVISFEDVPNNLCFWYCLAHHKNPSKRLDRLAGTVKKLFEEYYKTTTKNYQGVDFDDLEAIENQFSIKINVYVATEKKVLMVRHSSSPSNNIMNLNLYSDTKEKLNHFSYIKNINTLSKVFQCADCHTFLSEAKKMTRHLLTCSKGEQKIIFEEGNYSPKPSIFENLEEHGIFVERGLRFYPYYVFYDFETYLKPNECTSSSKLQFTGTHKLLSISLKGSEEENPVFIPVTTTTEEALDIMMNTMNEIRKKYIQLLYPNYSGFFKRIGEIKDEKTKKTLRKDLFKWIEEMPVYGLNSAAYDLNVIKKYLPMMLAKHTRNYGNVSKSEKLWIRSIEEELGRNIEQNKKIGRYNVDGYDEASKMVYEFNGCLFHGCSKCYDSNDINPLTGDKMSVLYEKTIKKEASLREMGYNVRSIWSCEFIEPKDMQLNDIIKCNNKYRVISSGQFCFRDISAFLEPGTSLDKFLQAFDTEIVKGVFPHRVTQNISEYVKQYHHLRAYSGNVIELLKHSSIPSKEWFYNDLKGEDISQELYDDIRLKFKTLYDLLRVGNRGSVRFFNYNRNRRIRNRNRRFARHGSVRFPYENRNRTV